MDSSELLSCKENIQPLRYGRDAVKLCQGLLATSDEDTERLLQNQKNEFETLLRDNSVEDPMEVWYNYVIWLEQSFPSQTHKANIGTVLKKCITKFKQSDDYKNDERFVRLCLKYAFMNGGSTTDIFGQLYSHGIGTKCSIFYIAWAEVFAMSETFSKAAKVYQKGIDMLAQPIELLKAAEQKFQAFMVKRMVDSGEVFQPTTAAMLEESSRKAYNKIKPVTVGAKTLVPSVRVGANITTTGKYQNALKPSSKANVPLTVYQDDDENGVEIQPTAKLAKVKSHKELTKENQIKPGVWTDATKKTVPFSIPAKSLPFQVHVDESESNAVPVKPSAPVSSALKPKQLFDEFNVDYSTTPLFWPDPYDPKSRPMYRKEQVYAGGMEFQFEELRAIAYRRRMAEREKAKKCESTPAPVQTTTKPMAPSIGKESQRKELGSKTKLAQDSGRKSYKVRASEESRSARRKIAVNGEGGHSARKSNFAGVVRRITQDFGNDGGLPQTDVPSDSFINQTIHTKEAVNEMRELWFAKSASPAAATTTDLPPPPPPSTAHQPPATPFEVYVDESCLGTPLVNEVTPCKAAEHPRPVPFRKPCPPLHKDPEDGDDDDKENAIPVDYVGPSGKSTRPVTGILTHANNVPCALIEEQEEVELDDSGESFPEPPGNITETWNFTQAFNFPKNMQASTPNVRRSLYQRPPSQTANVRRDPLSVCDEPDEVEAEALDLKVAAPASENPSETAAASKKLLPRVPSGGDQKTYEEACPKNLSIIVETSREYKSSSSGSSGACSKLQPFTPGESRTEAQLKRCYSYSQTEESRKTPFACKTQSTNGYEASAELSCSGFTKPPITDVKSTVDHEPTKNTEKNVAEVVKAVEKLEINTAAVPLQDIDPFDVRLNEKLLEEINFPRMHHLVGCNFEYERLPLLKLHSTVKLGINTFDIKKVLGEGAYAKIFKVQSQETGAIKVLKYQKPAFPWEFYIAREIQARCTNKTLAQYFMKIEEGYFFENASLLVSSPVEFGDLLSAINMYKINQGKPMSDYLALYFTVQILEIVEVLHSFRIIHGDIKPDNFLLKKLNDKLTLEMIDFGRSIDLTLLPTGTTFTRVVTTDGFTCVEMQSGKPWTYQIDLYGVAACIHCLLFGDYMKVVQKAGVWEISKSIPRYMAKSGWKQVFATLLNVPSCTEMPDLGEMRSLLNEKLEAYGPQPDLLKLTNFLQNR